MSGWYLQQLLKLGAARHGRAVQVDPIKSMLTALGTKRLKLKFGELLSSFAFKFNLRRYSTCPACRPPSWCGTRTWSCCGRCRCWGRAPPCRAPAKWCARWGGYVIKVGRCRLNR